MPSDELSDEMDKLMAVMESEDEPTDQLVIIGLLHAHLAAERAHADRLAEALRNEQRYHYLRVETVNLLAEHDRKREQER